MATLLSACRSQSAVQSLQPDRDSAKVASLARDAYLGRRAVQDRDSVAVHRYLPRPGGGVIVEFPPLYFTNDTAREPGIWSFCVGPTGAVGWLATAHVVVRDSGSCR